MKRKLPAMAALVALLACALGGAALATAGPALQTEVSIRFQESIHFDRMQGEGGMDIDFGIQPLPMPDVDIHIPIADGSHTLRVRDGRVNAGNWSVSAKFTAYPTSGSETLTSYLMFYEPTPSTGLTLNLSPPGSPPHPPNLRYSYIDTSDRKVVDARSGLTQGSYDVTTAPENTHFRMLGNQATRVKPVTYTTTVIWTLTSTPTTP